MMFYEGVFIGSCHESLDVSRPVSLPVRHSGRHQANQRRVLQLYSFLTVNELELVPVLLLLHCLCAQSSPFYLHVLS
jgi:hypothetical protein